MSLLENGTEETSTAFHQAQPGRFPSAPGLSVGTQRRFPEACGSVVTAPNAALGQACYGRMAWTNTAGFLSISIGDLRHGI